VTSLAPSQGGAVLDERVVERLHVEQALQWRLAGRDPRDVVAQASAAPPVL
jgi:hypothetical protein